MADERSKVFIFTAGPCICRDLERKRSRLDIQGGQAQAEEPKRNVWKESHLHFDGTKFVKPAVLNSKTSEDSEESSNIRLDYDVNCLQESLTFYLDSEFLGFSGYCVTDISTPVAVQVSDTNPDENQQDFHAKISVLDVDLQKEFHDVNEASQCLLLESLAPSSDLLENSECLEESRENKRLDESNENDDKHISTHPCVADDIYTQTCGSFRSPGNSVSLSSEAGAGAISPAVESVAAQVKHVCPPLPRVYDNLSMLIECTEKRSLVNAVFVVLQVNVIREIQIRSGPSAGQYVALSSLLVADESKSYFKLTLWREASSWTEKILPGDFMVATSIQIGSWRSENIGQTTYRSNLYNLHQPKKPLSSEWCQLVSQERLDLLISWTRQNHPYLFTSARAKTEVVFRKIAELEDNTLVHFRGLLTSVDVSASLKGMYKFRHEQLPKIVLTFCETSDQLIKLCLWGQQAAWLRDLQAGIQQVWEMLYVTVKYDSKSGSMFLHSTPKSSKRELPNGDANASEILSRCAPRGVGRSCRFHTIRELFEAKYNGAAEVEACVSSLTFHVSDVSLTFNGETDLEDLRARAHKLVYTGCGTCSRSLAQDKSSIYVRCTYCVAMNYPQYKATVSYCYKPFTMSLRDGKGIIETVEVKHEGATQLFRGFPAKHLTEKSEESLDKFINTVRDVLQNRKPRAFILLCHTALDENSFVQHRHFSLGMLPS